MTDFKQAVESYRHVGTASTAAIEAARKEAADFIVRGLRDIAEGFFAEFPDAHGFGWRQYAPYWNDGDPCVFSVHEVELVDHRGQLDYSSSGEIWEKLQLIDQAVHTVDEDVYAQVFGEDCMVVVNRESVVVEEIDHD